MVFKTLQEFICASSLDDFQKPSHHYHTKMLKGLNHDFYDFTDHQFPCLNLNPTPCKDSIDEAIYSSDEFRMYAFKIKKCTRTRSHDWTECPYAHRGEKAQRRDPRKVHYSAIACPAFRNGQCNKGDACEFAHGVFEYWLHPARYRTRACNAGRFCQRKVCFFAHTPEQLRCETKYKCHHAYKARMNGCHHKMGNGSGGAERATPAPPPESTSMVGVSDFLKSLRGLKIRDGCEEGERFCGGHEGSDFDFPNIDWISELVN